MTILMMRRTRLNPGYRSKLIKSKEKNETVVLLHRGVSGS
jgi:hypothetical protein